MPIASLTIYLFVHAGFPDCRLLHLELAQAHLLSVLLYNKFRHSAAIIPIYEVYAVPIYVSVRESLEFINEIVLKTLIVWNKPFAIVPAHSVSNVQKTFFFLILPEGLYANGRHVW